MATRRPRAAEPAKPAADDFKRISGIGTAIEQRLHSAGILTFAQLAALAPEDIIARIGSQAGLSAQRIIEEDWIGQAGALAPDEPRPPSRPLDQPPAPDSTSAGVDPANPDVAEHIDPALARPGPRRAQFTIELLLGPQREVQRTSVTHIQSGLKGTTWSGWDVSRLVQYMVECAGLRLTAHDLESAPPAPLADAGVPATGRRRELRCQSLTVTAIDRQRQSILLRPGQPCRITLTLDLSDLGVVADEALSYQTTISARSLLGHQQYLVAEARGTLELAEQTAIIVEGNSPPAGVYHLDAAIVLTGAGAEYASQVEGELILVYPPIATESLQRA